MQAGPENANVESEFQGINVSEYKWMGTAVELNFPKKKENEKKSENNDQMNKR